MSVSFDHLVLTNPLMALFCIGGTFAGLTLITETILYALKIRFPARYRFTYYLLLSLIFFFPLLIAPGLASINGVASSWIILGFTSICATAFLTLLPAINYGKAYVAGWLQNIWTGVKSTLHDSLEAIRNAPPYIDAETGRNA